jgi:hypothetical protein
MPPPTLSTVETLPKTDEAKAAGGTSGENEVD